MNDQDLVPDRLGAYRLLDRIGEGGMGVVYLARDLGHRTVALKVLRSSVAGDPIARRRLAREVETMQRVHSPNVAEVIDADLTGEMPYIVTRFVPGRTLDDLVADCGPLRGPALAQLACGLADALVAVHAAGVVHRDLKPSNVMLVHDTPVVIDFGIAQGPDATRLTMTGMFMGTPGYLAPEVIEGGPSSQASDVHAWGATVGYAATGRPPFGSGSYESIFYRIVNGQADLDGAPVVMVPLLAVALARDPAYRPPAVQLRAQAGVLDPAALVPAPPQGATLGAAAAPGVAGATRADVAPAQAGAVAAGLAPAAGLPPATGLPALAGHPQTVPAASHPQTAIAGGAGEAAALAATVPAGFDPALTVDPGQAVALSPSTRPLGAPPLPDDLRDVLTPVRYGRQGGGAGASRARGGAWQPAPVPATGGPPAAAVAAGKDSVAGTRWHPVLVFAAVMVVASVAVILPIAGTVAAFAFFAVLRTAGLVQRRSAARRQVRGTRVSDPLVTALSLPWLLIRALLALLLLAPLALSAAALAAAATVVITPGAWPYRALAYAAGVLVIFYGLGPGSGLSRAQLRRIFGAVPKTPAAQLVALLGMTALAIAALTTAVTSPSVFWPTVVPHEFIRFGINHLGPLRRLAYHFGVAHHFRTVRGILLRHLARLGSFG